jgi:hypothetical protein
MLWVDAVGVTPTSYRRDVRPRPCTTPMFLSWRRSKPDVRDPLKQQADAPRPSPARHGACQPASKTATEFPLEGVPTTHLPAFTGCKAIKIRLARAVGVCGGRGRVIRLSYKMAGSARLQVSSYATSPCLSLGRVRNSYDSGDLKCRMGDWQSHETLVYETSRS